MISLNIFGEPFVGSFSDDDASALDEPTSRFALYKAGTATAIVLGALDVVVITDIAIGTGGTTNAKIYDGADNAVDAGELIFHTNTTTTGTNGISQQLATPHFCKPGTYPKLKTSAGVQTDAVLHGVVIRN